MMKVTSTAKRIDKSSVLHLHRIRPNQGGKGNRSIVVCPLAKRWKQYANHIKQPRTVNNPGGPLMYEVSKDYNLQYLQNFIKITCVVFSLF